MQPLPFNLTDLKGNIEFFIAETGDVFAPIDIVVDRWFKTLN